MFLVVLVCLYVCSVYPQDYLASDERICMQLLPELIPLPGQ